jgi:hydroxyacylglutathione hydrolase
MVDAEAIKAPPCARLGMVVLTFIWSFAKHCRQGLFAPDYTVRLDGGSAIIYRLCLYIYVISVLPGGSLESNAYLVMSDKVCVIDPGIYPARVLNHIRDYNIRIDVLINTHCHFDHVGANPGVLDAGSVKSLCHCFDAPALEAGDPSLQLSGFFGMEPVRHPIDRMLSEGDVVDLGGTVLEIVHTPGHTAGSICVFEPESRSLFTGDTVFAGSVGRTDLKGGSSGDLEESVGRLADYAEERDVASYYPGHGPAAGGEGIRAVWGAFFG